MLIVVSFYLPLPSTAREIQKFKNSSFFPNSSSKPNFTNIVANSAYIYDVSVSTTCGEYHPSGLIVSILHKLRQITVITTIIDLSNLHYFHLHNF